MYHTRFLLFVLAIVGADDTVATKITIIRECDIQVVDSSAINRKTGEHHSFKYKEAVWVKESR